MRVDVRPRGEQAKRHLERGELVLYGWSGPLGVPGVTADAVRRAREAVAAGADVEEEARAILETAFPNLPDGLSPMDGFGEPIRDAITSVDSGS